MSEIQDGGGPALVKLVLLSADLAGFARWAVSHDALEIAALLDRYYVAAGEIVDREGGRIVKFMGDGVFAAFEEARCLDAIRAAEALLAIDVGVPQLVSGVAVHVAQVAAGEIGPPAHRRWDVFGVGVNHLFRMGGGPGLRLSEPVYRRLPNEARTGFRKHETPATYHRIAPPRASG